MIKHALPIVLTIKPRMVNIFERKFQSDCNKTSFWCPFFTTNSFHKSFLTLLSLPLFTLSKREGVGGRYTQLAWISRIMLHASGNNLCMWSTYMRGPHSTTTYYNTFIKVTLIVLKLSSNISVSPIANLSLHNEPQLGLVLFSW